MSLDQPRYVDVYLQPLSEWLNDPSVVEIAVNPDGKVWIERSGSAHMEATGATFPAQKAGDLATALVANTNGKLSREDPVVSGKIAYQGRPLRIQVVISPAVEVGASITIRLFGDTTSAVIEPSWLFGEAVSLDEKRRVRIAEIEQLSKTDLKAALKQVMEHRLNIVISGGTSTGKTTFARWLLNMVETSERLITIEDAYELFPKQENTVALLAERREGSARSTEALLQATLRMRPDRIIVGELRGREALTFLEAINTGHGGSVTTLHAETARLAVDRLALMVLQAGTPLTFAEVKDYIARSIDLIVQLGRVDGKRGVTEMFLPDQEEQTVLLSKGDHAHETQIPLRAGAPN